MDTPTYVQAVNGNGGGQVHVDDCFIVTTRWPDLDWRPVPGPATCGFCMWDPSPLGRDVKSTVDTVWLMDRPVPIRIGEYVGEVIAYDPAVHTILVEWGHGELESHELRAFHQAFRHRVLMQVACARGVSG